MKKRLVILFIIFSVIAAGGLGVHYFLSLRKVTFTLEDTVSNISIYRSDQRMIESLTTNSQLSLQEGEYYAIPNGDTIATDKINFVVGKDDATIHINPPYTKEYLDDALDEETADIEAALSAKYPSIFTDYTLSSGALYERGQWFGGLLKPKVSDMRDLRDPYRVVLLKEKDEWKVIRRPEYILTSSRYQEVPVSVLREINQIIE